MTFKSMGHSSSRLLCFLISVFATVSVSAQTTNTSVPAAQPVLVWERYAVSLDRFSVELPVLPAMNTAGMFIPKLNKTRRERILGAYAGGVVYAIYTYQNLTQLQSIDEILAEFHQTDPGKLKREITRNGVRGWEYAFQSGELSGINQFFVTRNHFYVFKAVGPFLREGDEGSSKFFESIQLTESPQGKEALDGPGVQPEDNSVAASENSNKIFMGRELNSKARVITKPEPTYTETARQNQITGTVMLRCVFSSSGAVTNLIAISKLPDGLTEKAMAAARQIRFIPGRKDGRFVSLYVQMEYNFNLY